MTGSIGREYVLLIERNIQPSTQKPNSGIGQKVKMKRKTKPKTKENVNMPNVGQKKKEKKRCPKKEGHCQKQKEKQKNQEIKITRPKLKCLNVSEDLGGGRVQLHWSLTCAAGQAEDIWLFGECTEV
ncbi:hypothetical protein HRR83_004953 [Exophiala dermatitidis]|uniref:Uncharacterized protein n=1 Tax=Exophiala dermatitidis TaxID=5970 RepID=A0AAN6IYM4_EXODE|nr:hypothetical protein HRR74_004882 [Exophiala dermatitidis]KAJ4519690.1 hypothetical protein HRR73_003750 [Exophiala dermatitidis]KAJ4534508.1 hypothetical protein HRR76_006432 [Exophiala dermatitidis]KAJ4551147.1 hypothetical protein HRR77_003491 [Exophiala dermatitidis]KAJ4561018.1 hypothetical protein HRR79_007580 [Exophiala dermatitidis]